MKEPVCRVNELYAWAAGYQRTIHWLSPPLTWTLMEAADGPTLDGLCNGPSAGASAALNKQRVAVPTAGSALQWTHTSPVSKPDWFTAAERVSCCLWLYMFKIVNWMVNGLRLHSAFLAPFWSPKALYNCLSFTHSYPNWRFCHARHCPTYWEQFRVECFGQGHNNELGGINNTSNTGSLSSRIHSQNESMDTFDTMTIVGSTSGEKQSINCNGQKSRLGQDKCL